MWSQHSLHLGLWVPFLKNVQMHKSDSAGQLGACGQAVHLSCLTAKQKDLI